jgi:NADH:ubiquinone oxidoreductase subunit 4 (subunit M)
MFLFISQFLVPTYLMIGLLGSRERKIRAAGMLWLDMAALCDCLLIDLRDILSRIVVVEGCIHSILLSSSDIAGLTHLFSSL